MLFLSEKLNVSFRKFVLNKSFLVKINLLFLLSNSFSANINAKEFNANKESVEVLTRAIFQNEILLVSKCCICILFSVFDLEFTFNVNVLFLHFVLVWKNLVHALAFYTRNNVISQTDQNMLIVLYNAMTDLTLLDEFRNFILNAFLQLQFSEDSLNTLYKLGLHNSLLQIIENYAIENEFDGCFTVKPKSEVTETVVEESESDEEYDRDFSKKKM